jgi:hypothetical protein
MGLVEELADEEFQAKILCFVGCSWVVLYCESLKLFAPLLLFLNLSRQSKHF